MSGRANVGLFGLEITSILDLCGPLIEYLPGTRGSDPRAVAVALKSFGSIFAEVEGDPRVLALHGWARRGSDFGPALGGLGYIAPDLPGFGASPPPASAIGAEGYASLLEPIVESLAADAILVGHSFGGRIAVVLAATHPEKFAGVVLTGVPLVKRPSSRRPALLYRLGRWANRYSLIPDATMERLRRRFGSADYRSATGVMRNVLVKAVNEQYADFLSRVKAPVLLLWGDEDSEVPLPIAELAASSIPDARVEVVAGAGHFLPVTHPAELRRAVESFWR